nr:cation:dicarboxylase symporter family transporter [uncultured Sphingosinicella sp.]
MVAGLLLGVLAGASGASLFGRGFEQAVSVAGLIGGLWLDALRMTIIPLVFALVVTGMASASATLQAGGIAARALVLFVLLLLGSAIVTALMVPPMLSFWAPAPGALDALRAGAGAAPDVPPALDGLKALIPTNVVAAAANDAIVPLVLFALVLGMALTRIGEGRRAALFELFHGIADAMLVIVGWVLVAAPLGVFALALVAGSKLGIDAGAALLHYIGMQIAVALLLILIMYVLVAAAGRMSPLRFAKAALPAQAVAFSTQSSLASLPPMVAAAERLELPERVSSLVLPLAVATFKISAPLVALTVALTLAHVSGIEVGPGQVLIAILLAAVSTLAVVGLPGQVSFFAANAPAALAIGAPIELLPLLLAVDTIPDMIRTVANVTADMAAAVVVAARTPAVVDKVESQLSQQ